ILPPLSAGRYRLDVATEVAVDGTAQSLDGQRAYFDIDGPRFTLAPNEVAGVFPPRNGHGPFDEAVAHVALGRRTLPWERAFAAGDSDGFFAVIMSNRVPQRGRKYRCCLVSIEERTDLVPQVAPPWAGAAASAAAGDAQPVFENPEELYRPPGTRIPRTP